MSNHEPVLLVSRHNHPRGSCQRGRMQRQRLVHRASYVVVQDLAGRVCVQKRAADKHFYPGGWDLAAGGVMRPDESVAQGLPLAVVLVCQPPSPCLGRPVIDGGLPGFCFPQR